MRKLDVVSRFLVYLVASMGPQLYRCGNSGEHLRSNHPHAASMGPQLYRCGNSAFSLSLRAISCMLQWGPQLYRCGNYEVGEGAPSISIRASMGPQLYRCGNVEHNVNFEEYPLLLQWGRNFIVAEITYVQLRGFQQFKVLQWGRNFIVAETFSMPVCSLNHRKLQWGPQLYRCGNVEWSDGTKSCRNWLQWGRNFIVAET